MAQLTTVETITITRPLKVSSYVLKKKSLFQYATYPNVVGVVCYLPENA